MPAGYSKRSLAAKLGIKPGFKLCFINQPDGYEQMLGDLPDGTTVCRELGDSLDFIHFFSKNKSDLEKHLPLLKAAIVTHGMVWVSWPKKASKVPTDLTGDVVRSLGLATGLVDIKVCAVDEIWSGLKFVIPVKDRRG